MQRKLGFTLLKFVALSLVFIGMSMCAHRTADVRSTCTFEKAATIAYKDFKHKYGQKIELVTSKDTLGYFYNFMTTKVPPSYRDGSSYVMYTGESIEYYLNKEDCSIEKKIKQQ